MQITPLGKVISTSHFDIALHTFMSEELFRTEGFPLTYLNAIAKDGRIVRIYMYIKYNKPEPENSPMYNFYTMIQGVSEVIYDTISDMVMQASQLNIIRIEQFDPYIPTQFNATQAFAPSSTLEASYANIASVLSKVTDAPLPTYASPVKMLSNNELEYSVISSFNSLLFSFDVRVSAIYPIKDNTDQLDFTHIPIQRHGYFHCKLEARPDNLCSSIKIWFNAPCSEDFEFLLNDLTWLNSYVFEPLHKRFNELELLRPSIGNMFTNVSDYRIEMKKPNKNADGYVTAGIFHHIPTPMNRY